MKSVRYDVSAEKVGSNGAPSPQQEILINSFLPQKIHVAFNAVMVVQEQLATPQKTR
jgi:hypothetical protein